MTATQTSPAEPEAVRPRSAVSAEAAPAAGAPVSAGRIDVGGIGFDPLSEAGCVERVIAELAAGRGGVLVTANLDHLVRYRRSAEYRGLVGDATMVVADGMPLVWAARLQGTPLPERVAGSNLVFSLTGAAAGAGRSVFLLGGGTPETAGAAAAVFRERYPGLNVCGTHYPPFGFEQDEREMAAIRGAVAAAAPDLVYVALGSPKQERLIRAIRGVAPSAWWVGVGISLSFATGDVKRAPVWIQKVGLEWVHRLAQEPRRLFARYVVDGLPACARLMAVSAWRRWCGRNRG